MLVSVVGFALMNLTIKFLDRLPATELVLFRCVISLALCLYALRRRKISVFGNNKKWLIIRGLCGVTGLALFFFTLQELPIGSAVTLQYLSPIFTAIFGIFILGERVRIPQWFFFLISFSGIAVVKGFDTNITPPLFFAGIGSALFSGLAYASVRKLKDTDHPLVVVLYFPLIATPIMLVASIFNWVQPQGWEWTLLLLVGIFTQIAQVNMTKALQSAEANEITGMKYLGIVFALSFDFLIFDVRYSIFALAGIILVLLGVVANLVYKARLRKRKSLLFSKT